MCDTPMKIEAGCRIYYGTVSQLVRICDPSGISLRWPDGTSKKVITFIWSESSFAEFANFLGDLNGLGVRKYDPEHPNYWGFEFVSKKPTKR